ncbi:Cytochrome P450 family protein [Rhynchospora pubera]|uniref:Cytochrome P450 family protein n=1 Tax=Rhynchospora pubera TaxID=906938 RepID=A0AAV8HT29_9POAL|nr:Cytochrome P450 family protein [Rhynchospora pubera]
MVLTNNVALRAIMGGKCKNQKLVLDDIIKAFEQHTGFNLANMFPSSCVARKLSGADLIAAGTDTTAASLDWVMAELIKNPAVMNKAQIEVQQQLQGRRDSRYSKDAEEFKRERFAEYNRYVNFNGTDFEIIPFGAGRRICPGMTFALATLELALANLLFHFNWELPGGTKPDDLDMIENAGFTARRKSPLLLHARRHIHASS